MTVLLILGYLVVGILVSAAHTSALIGDRDWDEGDHAVAFLIFLIWPVALAFSLLLGSAALISEGIRHLSRALPW